MAELADQLINAFDSLLLNKNNHHQPLGFIKELLVGASITKSTEGIEFINLQNNIETNASSILLQYINQLQISPDNVEPLRTTFVLLQGLLHLHQPSQNLFKSQYNLKILLKFLPLSLHSPEYHKLAIPLLDLILLSFIDSVQVSQTFEATGGLEILVQAMKSKALKVEIRVKVLETLWAWWIDDTEEEEEIHKVPSPDLQEEEEEEEEEEANTSAEERGDCTPKPIVRVQIHPSSTPRKPPTSSSSSSPMVKSSSEGSSHHPNSKKSSDPAIRLRSMLENTVGQFVPATPHHNHNRTSLHKSHPLSPSKKSSHHSSSPLLVTKQDDHGSEEEDLDTSPHKLFKVRERRTATTSANTPQRLIRHKQSASLGSIQASFNPTQSSEEDEKNGLGGSTQDRARPSTVFLSGTNTPSRRSTILDHTRPSSITPSDRKRFSVDTPKARPRPTSTPLRVNLLPSSNSRPTRLTPQHQSSSSSASSQDEESAYTPIKKTTTSSSRHSPLLPSRSGSGSGTGLIGSKQLLLTPVTPTSTNLNNLIVNGFLNPSTISSPNKKFINKPVLHSFNSSSSSTTTTMENHKEDDQDGIINHYDLESIVNGTDSDLPTSEVIALKSARKERVKKHHHHVKNLEPSQDSSTSTTTPSFVVGDSKTTTNGDRGHLSKSEIKTITLGKYMANSQELARNFQLIGVGFKHLSSSSKSSSNSKSKSSNSLLSLSLRI
ncbi:hypothetical protein Pst134EA_011119 [Puccinia striiformis f. sp. tritici]|uniref:hypothetical protein n=1 Tax=Puccinia striiformis f. sp. tritici TaxID=168172 RepID=UPI00200892D1|nr:hypothetical protein Pst134EA_011119 [Puccinia striiformis f. sp. tritici]KAH9467476.1 hypothetical protein Pst134EA_011119 [Puccinia striiformis f. sp. tritici]